MQYCLIRLKTKTLPGTLEKSQTQRPRPRIESLADLVFGLALSISAIILVGNSPTTSAGLFEDITTFALNFLILISVWLNYTSVTSILPIENTRTVVLNCVLLFAVSIEPFLFNLLTIYPQATGSRIYLLPTTSALYGLDIGGMMVILALFYLTLADEEKKLVPKGMLKEIKLRAITTFLSAVIFLLSALPIFNYLTISYTYVRTDLWFSTLVINWGRRLYSRRRIGRDVEAKGG